MNLVKDTLFFLIKFIISIWWVVIPIVLFIVYIKLRNFYKEQKEKREINWCLFEIIPPKEVPKTPKAMEQIFIIVNEISKWASFEIVGRAGGTHFYIRIPEKFRNLIESSIYAQYHEAVIKNISKEDSYINQFPPSLPNNQYDVWGTEFILGREDGYPIKTYPFFDEGHKKEEQIVDPIAGITETMSNLKSTEAIWLQILIKPADNKKWNKKAQDLIDEIMGKKSKSYMSDFIISFIGDIAEFIGNLLKAIFEHPSWSDKSDESDKKNKDLTPGKRKIIEAIEDKMSKIGFNSVIRFIYIDRRDAFTQLNISSVNGSLRQFNTNHLNSLVQNKKIKTEAKGMFKNKILESRKKRIFSNYISNNFPKKTSILNTEELATIYHFPSTGVKSPTLRRVSTKRGGSPENLPIQ